MSTVVCQGFQPCLDSQLVETTMLRLKLVEPKSPKPIFPSLDNLHDPNKIFLDGEMEFFKPFSTLRLSDKSLELCTENLGSESGSDTSEASIFSLDFDIEKKSLANEQRNLSYCPLRAMKKGNPRDFPPPLTTIRGSNSLQVRPHREEGRLVMKAIHAPTSGSYFQAERSQGRLRLTIMNNFDPMENENDENVINVEIQEDKEEDQELQEDENESNENEIYEDDDDDDDQEEYEGGESDEFYMREDWDTNRKEIGVEMEIGKFQRPSRCKEGGHNGDKGLCSWETFWVATS